MFALAALGSNAQISFTNSNSLLHSSTGVAGSNANVRSGNSLTVVDMNSDGLDDICKLADNGDVSIEFQKPGGSFNYLFCGNIGGTGAWSMVCGDVDRNGYKDVLTGYGSSVRLMKIDPTGSMSVTLLPGSSFFAQNMNFMDINNDGWLDIFACDDNSYSKLWLNNGSGSFPAEANNTVINFDITPGQTSNTSNDDSGNYGSVWTDFDNDGDIDLYIAKCRQAVSSGTDARRIDVLFENNNGTFTNTALSHGLGSGDQDWTSSFGDIDNDGDFDLFLTKHNTTSRIYKNTGSGNFVSDATITFGSMPMQSQFEDMDNDGFVDLIITGDNDHRIYHNNGNGTFSDVTPANFVVSGNTALSFASGDLNHDGKIDLYFSYGSTYNNPGTQDDRYWMNSTNNANHFLTIIPVATNTNHDGLGVRAFIYGPWGVQTREVRGGESYGTLNSGHLHFGLGSATTIDSVVLNWPSGVQTVIVNPTVDQFLNVGESGQCTLSGVVVTPGGNTNLCNGQTVTLSAPTGTGYTYLWSDGSTTQTITANTAGSYAVQVTQSPGCVSTSPSINVTMNADETPTVASSSNDLEFCQDGSVTLSSSPASSYLWSNGATTQSIVVTASGTYSVTIQGACQQWTSTATSVTVNPAPATPTGSDVYITSAQSVTLTATGTNDVWFDAATGGNQLATGNNYVTPVVTQDTTFYVEDQTTYGGASLYEGMKYHSGTNYSGSTFNSYMIFDVQVPCTLTTVKVYTDSPGNRLIELRNSSGIVLDTQMVNIPLDSSVITLNFPLTIGTSYQLGCNQAQNQALLGTVAPRLRRSNSNVSYPYNISGLVDITNSSQGSTVYYYFYDWNVVQQGMVCPSPRHPQSVLFVTGLNEAEIENFTLYPNPTNSSVNIMMKDNSEANTIITLTDLTGKTVNAVTVGSVKKDQVINFDMQNVAKGVYFITMKQNGNTTVQRVIKD